MDPLRKKHTWLFSSTEKQAMEQARLIQQQDEAHEADGEDDDDEEEEEEEEEDEDDRDKDEDDVWRKRRGSPEGRSETRGPGFPDEALRKRAVGREEPEDS